MARSERFNVEITATDSASAAIEAVAAATEKLGEKATVEIGAEDEATEVIEEVAAATGELDGTTAEVTAEAEDEATEVIEEVATAVEELDETTATATLDADDGASGAIEGAQGAAETFDGTTATATLDATDNVTDGEAITAATTAADGFEDTYSASLEATDDVTDSANLTDATSAAEGFEDTYTASLVAEDTTADTTDLADAETAAEGFEDTYTATLDADDATADGTDLADAEAAAEGFEDTYTATLDADDATAEGTDLSDAQGAADSYEGTYTATLDTENLASEDIAAVADELGTLDEVTASPDISMTGDDASDVTDVTEALGELQGDSATASLEVAGADDTANDMSSILGDLDTLGAGVVTGLAAAGLESVFSGAADNVLDVQTLATATGTTLENATGISEAFDLAGVPMQRLQTLIGRFNDKIKEMPELAEQLGITPGEDPVANFIAGVDALNESQLGANEKLALAIDLFGNKGAQSVFRVGAMVGDLSTAVEDIPDWQVVTPEDVRAAIATKEAFDELGDVVAELAQAGLPKMAELAEVFTKVVGFLGLLQGAGPILPDEEIHNTIALLDAMGDSMNEALGDPQFLEETRVGLGQLAFVLDDGKISAEEWAGLQKVLNGELTSTQLFSQQVTTAVEAEATATEEAAAAADEHAAAQKRAQAEYEASKAKLEGEIDALERSAQAQRDKADALDASGDAWLDERDALRTAQDASDAYAESLVEREDETRTATQIERDQAEALDNSVSSYEKHADAVVESERQTRAATGATLSDLEALDLHNEALLTDAATLQGPEKQALLEHTLRINGIPEARITTIFTDNDPNDLAQVERELDNASRARAALIRAAEDQASIAHVNSVLNALEAARHTTLWVHAQRAGDWSWGPFGSWSGQHGSTFTPQAVGLVGEAGRELVALPTGSKVFRNDQTEEMLRNGLGGGGGNTVNHNTIHMPAGTASSTVNQIRRYLRRNGSTVGATAAP